MRNILIPVIVVALGMGLYFGFQFFKQNKSADIWQFVPESSAIIYESENLNSLFEAIDSISFFDAILISRSSGSSSDSLFFLNMLNDINTIVSFHVTGKESINVLFVFDLLNENKKELLVKQISELQEDVENVHTTRVYREIEINEISNNDGQFSYFIYENMLILSEASFLVEDAIRTLLVEELKSIRESNNELFVLSKLKNDYGNLYVNGSEITDLINVLLKNDSKRFLLKSIFYDLNIDENKLLLNGFGYSRKGTELNRFNDQDPAEIEVLEYIPNDVSYMYHIGLSDTEKWLKINKEEDSLSINRLVKWVGSEIALYETERRIGDDYEKVVLVRSIDINEALNHINVLAESKIDLENDSIYLEKYAGYEIKELKVKEFPQKAFGDMFGGFENSYYLVIDEYFIFGNSVHAIKSLLNSVEEEETWNRSVMKNKFLQSTLMEANVSLFINIPRIWDRILVHLDDKWKDLFLKMELQNTISNAGIQFSNVGDKFYSSAVVEFSTQEKKKGSFDVERVTYLESSVSTKPYIVKNHVDHSFEVLVQDSLNQLYLVDKQGDIKWKDSIGESIVSRVFQIDYYKNRKLQYFFASSNKLHLIDRNGDYVEGFPKQLNTPIHQLSVVDYNNSKKYRFIIEDGNGEIYVYDKFLKNLEGWMPRIVGGSLSEPVSHISVRGKDYMLAIQKNGTINVMNRRGENVNNFPLNLDVELSGDSFLSIGSTIDNTKISVLSNDGKLITFNLEGNVVNSKELYKPTKETQFKISVGSSKKSFIIYRYNNRRMAILDSKGDQLFEKDYLDANISKVQFYDLGTGSEIYAVNDVNQNLTYIYDHRGEMVNFTPLNSSFGIGLLDYTSRLNKRMLYISYQSNLSVYSY